MTAKQNKLASCNGTLKHAGYLDIVKAFDRGAIAGATELGAKTVGMSPKTPWRSIFKAPVAQLESAAQAGGAVRPQMAKLERLKAILKHMFSKGQGQNTAEALGRGVGTYGGVGLPAAAVTQAYADKSSAYHAGIVAECQRRGIAAVDAVKVAQAAGYVPPADAPAFQYPSWAQQHNQPAKNKTWGTPGGPRPEYSPEMQQLLKRMAPKKDVGFGTTMLELLAPSTAPVDKEIGPGTASDYALNLPQRLAENWRRAWKGFTHDPRRNPFASQQDWDENLLRERRRQEGLATIAQGRRTGGQQARYPGQYQTQQGMVPAMDQYMQFMNRFGGLTTPNYSDLTRQT